MSQYTWDLCEESRRLREQFCTLKESARTATRQTEEALTRSKQLIKYSLSFQRRSERNERLMLWLRD